MESEQDGKKDGNINSVEYGNVFVVWLQHTRQEL